MMDMVCEKCGGRQFWDNRATKRNPRAPDFKCKNKDCGNGVWLKDSEKAALGATSPVSRNGASPNRPPIVLDKMMRECVKAAFEIANGEFREVRTDGSIIPGLDHALVLNMATTLYISRCKSEGILHVEKAALDKLAAKLAAEKAEAERKAAEEQRTSRLEWTPVAPMPDSDLPF